LKDLTNPSIIVISRLAAIYNRYRSLGKRLALLLVRQNVT
jgi:hypothetical protein